MKNHIKEISDDYWVVSVHPDNRETLCETLGLVPLVDATEIRECHKTKVTVQVSDLADEKDRKAIRRRINRVAGVEDSTTDGDCFKITPAAKVDSVESQWSGIRVWVLNKHGAAVKAKIQELSGLNYVFDTAAGYDTTITAHPSTLLTLVEVRALEEKISDICLKVVRR